MKRTILIAGFILILALTAVAIAHQRNTKYSVRDATKTEWEYLVVAGGRANLSGSGNSSSMSKLSIESGFRENYPLERNFDRLGAEGWELISVLPTQPEPVYYFKRAK